MPLLRKGFCKEFREFAFQKFSGRTFGDVIYKMDGFGALEVGEVEFAEGDDVLRLDLGSWILD